jgi:hypothetical protein
VQILRRKTSSVRHIEDDKHALKLEFWTPEEYEIDVIHAQSCTTWFGCQFREKNGCPNYHHAHSLYDCPIGYMIESIGLKDALFSMDAQYEEETLAVLKRYIGEKVPIHCGFSWGTHRYGLDGYEYDEELIWTFKPYYTHLWRRDAAICSRCGSTKLYVLETQKECDYGKPE